MFFFEIADNLRIESSKIMVKSNVFFVVKSLIAMILAVSESLCVDLQGGMNRSTEIIKFLTPHDQNCG